MRGKDTVQLISPALQMGIRSDSFPSLAFNAFLRFSTIRGICFRSKRIPKRVNTIGFWDSFETEKADALEHVPQPMGNFIVDASLRQWDVAAEFTKRRCAPFTRERAVRIPISP